MKKILLSASLLLAHFCHAQTSFGIKGGLNIASLTGPGVVDGSSTLTAGNVGVFINAPISKQVNLQVEPSVSWEGETFDSYSVTNSHGSYNFRYINIPILFHKYVVAGLFAETGPQVGVKLSGKSVITYYPFTNVPTGAITTDFSDKLSSFNFGWDFGLGYQFSKLLAVGARYNLGLTNLGSSAYPQKSYKNSVFSFNLFISPFHSSSEKK